MGMEPKQIFWTGREKEDATFLFAELPSEAEREILEAVAFLREKGKDSSTYDIGEAGPMTHTKVFGQRLRHMMVHDTGAILTKLPIEAFRESAADEDDFEERAKLAYFLLCSATGQPEGSTRGRLFDVKSSKGLSSKQDNVLFSVVDTECDWHTDGASADRFIDTVGLLCGAAPQRPHVGASGFQELLSHLPRQQRGPLRRHPHAFPLHALLDRFRTRKSTTSSVPANAYRFRLARPGDVHCLLFQPCDGTRRGCHRQQPRDCSRSGGVQGFS